MSLVIALACLYEHECACVDAYVDICIAMRRSLVIGSVCRGFLVRHATMTEHHPAHQSLAIGSAGEHAVCTHAHRHTRMCEHLSRQLKFDVSSVRHKPGAIK